MLTACFHALRRHRPYGTIQIKFIPACAKDLARAGGGENGKFERKRGSGSPLPQVADEGRQLGIIHGCVVATGELPAFWQELIQVTTPAGGVLAAAQPFRLGGICDRARRV